MLATGMLLTNFEGVNVTNLYAGLDTDFDFFNSKLFYITGDCYSITDWCIPNNNTSSRS